MTKIKICGLTREEDVVFAADSGADFLGFIFVPSTPRFIEPERAAAISASIRQRDQRPQLVGVFRDASAEYVREIASIVGLDLAQLHGAESDEDIRTMGIPTIKAFRVGATLPDTSAHPSADWFLFDAFEERRHGGTGRRFDWSLLGTYPRTKPFFLAGGLSPENVAAAISLARPDAVDVSSGVELEPGIKDHDRIDDLIRRVRRS
jgi:phosphoribosylanthranilate isomerase